MRKQFKYTALKYRSAYDLGEQLNIGLLFIFPDDKKVIFIYPNNLKRLNNAFPNANIKDIFEILQSFEHKSKELTINFNNLLLDYAIFCDVHFLVTDASALFFGEWKSGFCTNVQQVVDRYKQHYFTTYENVEFKINNHE